MKTTICLLISVIFCLNASAQSEIAYGSNSRNGKYLDVNDIKIYYETYGVGEPLLLLHGASGSIQDMAYQIPQLSKFFKVFAIDSRAQGRSTDSDKEISFALMASDMADFIEKLKLGSVNLVGWSDGGNTGLELAYAYPDKVKKLVIIGSNFSHENFLADSKQTVFMSKNDSLLIKTSEPMKRYFESSRSLSANPDRLQIIQKKLNELDEKYPNFTKEQLNKITTPVLVVAGDHDIISENHTMDLYSSLTHSELCIVPGATHLVPWEQPEFINMITIKFLRTAYRDIDRYYFFRQ